MTKTVLVRLAWNPKMWREAVFHGNDDEQGFAANMGRAEEDWNFALDQSVDGKLIGFSQGVPGKKEVAQTGGRFNVIFFARRPQDQRVGIVGTYFNAMLLNEKEKAHWWQRLDEKGIVGLRMAQLVRTVGKRGANDFQKNRPITWMVDPEDVLVLPEMPLLPLPWGDLSGRRGQFTNAFKTPDPSRLVDQLKYIDSESSELANSGFPEPSGSSSSEGRAQQVKHLRRERKLAQKLKAERLSMGPLTCDACKLSYEAKYGDAATAVFDAHHPVPLSKVSLKGVELTTKDLILLCVNCHRVAHRTNKLTLKALIAFLAASKKKQNLDGVSTR